MTGKKGTPHQSKEKKPTVIKDDEQDLGRNYPHPCTGQRGKKKTEGKKGGENWAVWPTWHSQELSTTVK